MFSNPTVGMATTDDTIMFDELSLHIQKRLLESNNITHPREKSWDILPVAYIYQNKALMNQDEIDDEALLQLGII